MAMPDSLRDALNKGAAAMSVKSETLAETSRVKASISSAQKQPEAEKAPLARIF